MLGMARTRRLAALFAFLGFSTPYLPGLFNVPRLPFGCGTRYGEFQCAELALGFIVLAGVFAVRGAPGVGRRAYWIRVSAVGAAWAICALLWDGWIMC